MAKTTPGQGLRGARSFPAQLGNYQLLRQLGRGAMGSVYEAFDNEQGCRVALKVLSPFQLDSLHRFRREFRALAEIHHANLVSLYDFGEQDDCWYFTMELVEGLPFDQGVRRAGATEDRLRFAFAQLVQGVQALHTAGKLHRDLKPSNVLVRADGTVVVLDFGLVLERQETDSSEGLAGVGTPAYMAPEQGEGAPASEASDWYAVGVMLYEALTGSRPFRGGSAQVMREKLQHAAPRASDLGRDLPGDLDALCSQLLQRDPSARPTGAVVAQHFAVAPAQTSRRPGRSGRAFVGRDDEITTLTRSFSQVGAPGPRVALVSGPSGIGKTALCERFVATVADDVTVLRARCYERESIPYKALDAIVEAITRHLLRAPAAEVMQILPRRVNTLARAFPSLLRVPEVERCQETQESPDPASMRYHASFALKELLQRLAARGPVLLWVDDLQWADEDSAVLFDAVLDGPEAPGVFFLGTFCSEAARHSGFLRRALHAGGFATDESTALIELGPLPQAQTLLLARLMGAGSHCEAVAGESGGVPFFVEALVQSLSDRNPARPHPASASEVSLHGAIARQLASLSREARQVLEVAAVAGGPIAQVDAVEAAGLSGDALTALNELRAGRLLRTRENDGVRLIETYHDRIRESVAATLPQAERRTLHARIAKALEARRGSHPESLLGHLEAAGLGASAARAAQGAAQSAFEQLAFHRAAELYRTAIRLLPPAAAQRERLQERRADALACFGRSAEAADAYLTAAKATAPNSVPRLERLAAQHLLRAGRSKEGLALMRRLLARVGERCPEASAGAMRWFALEQVCLTLGIRPRLAGKEPASERLETLGAFYREATLIDPGAGAYLLLRYCRVARAVGNADEILQAAAWEAMMRALALPALSGRRVAQLAGEAQGLSARSATPYARGLGLLARVAACACEGRGHELVALAARAEAVFLNDCAGAVWEHTFSALWRWSVAELCTKPDDFVREAPQWRQLAREREDAYCRAVATLVMAMACLVQDAPDAALATLHDQAALLGGETSALSLRLSVRVADALLYRGDGEAAWQCVQGFWPRYLASPLSHLRAFQVLAEYVRGRAAVAAATREPNRLRDAEDAAQMLRKLSGFETPVFAALIGAGIHMRRGDHAAAARGLRQALSQSREADMTNIALYVEWVEQALTSECTRPVTSESSVHGILVRRGVRCPARMARLYVPGFERDERETK